MNASSRLDAHRRSIDIDICIRCTQPADSTQTIVTLHDDAEGNAAGWNPPRNFFTIKAPFELDQEFSLEATFVDPLIDGSQNSGNCHILGVSTPDTLFLNCVLNFFITYL